MALVYHKRLNILHLLTDVLLLLLLTQLNHLSLVSLILSSMGAKVKTIQIWQNADDNLSKVGYNYKIQLQTLLQASLFLAFK